MQGRNLCAQGIGVQLFLARADRENSFILKLSENICVRGYNKGRLTWVTLLWYLSFSLPMLFYNGFSVKLSKFEANIERDREKEVEDNMSMLFL